MNHVYKVIWSKVRNCYVAVSELAKSHSKGCSGKRIGRMLVAGAVVAGLMLPMGGAEAYNGGDYYQLSREGSWSNPYYYLSNYYYMQFNNTDYEGNNYTYYSGVPVATPSGYGISPIKDYNTNGGLIEHKRFSTVFIDSDGTSHWIESQPYSLYTENSSVQNNVAVGNNANAGGAANYVIVEPDSVTGYTEEKPSSGNPESVEFEGKTYYKVDANYISGGDGELYRRDDGKFIRGGWNNKTDNNGQTIQEWGYTIISENYFKRNANGYLNVDYEHVDDNGNPLYDLTWDDIGISHGNYNNVAIGYNATTTSSNSVAVGDTSTAGGWRSVAVGALSKAEGVSSIAIGDSSSASGVASTAIGNTSESTGYKSLAVGSQAKAFGDESIAIGVGNYDNTQTYGYHATAIGINAHADTSSAIAIGDGAKIDYDGAAAGIEQRRIAMNAIAVGQNARAAALDGTAVGRNTKAIMRNATAYGNNAHANAWNSIAIGNKAIAGKAERIYLEKKNEKGDVIGYEVLPTVKVTDDDGLKYVTQGAEFGDSAVAIGNRAKAIKEYTTAVGAGTNAEGWHAVAVGDSNQATGKFSTAIGAGWSENYTPGEENDDGSSADKDSINTEGDRIYTAMGANQAGGDYSTAVGYMNQTVGTQSTALGKDNAISGLSSLGIGAGNEVGAVAKDDNGVLSAVQENTVSGYAVGSYNKITGTEDSNAGAFGANNTVAGENGYAVGNSNTISEDGSGALAIGSGNTVEGENSIAVGTGHTVTGKNSGALGDPDIVNADSSYVVGNNSTIDKGADGSFVIGNDASATVEKSVALGSESHAYRDKENGGAGAGYDVTTGTNYAGDDADSPVWVSTLGAVSVGGTAKDTDAEIGTAATATRQITGVAAGTADTDAVNVAQLKLIGELSRTEVAAGTNVTVDESKDKQDGHTIYTVNGLKTKVTSSDESVEITATNEDNADKTGVIIYDLKVKPATNVAVKQGSNITVKTEKDGDITNYIVNATDTTYTTEVTNEGLEEGQVSKLTITNDITGDSTDFFDTDTHNGLKNDENDVKYENGKGSVTITDQDGNTTTINNIQDTTYTTKVTTDGLEEGQVSKLTITNDITGASTEFMDTDTTYKISEEAGEKGSGVVNTYTMTGTNGDKYTFEDTDTDTTYKIEEKREKKGTVAATYTVTDSNNNKVGEIQDTHNGLTGDTYKVEYDENGVGSVTIEDQDGNKATITNIQSGGEGNADAINRLGDQITRLDSKIEKVGAGAAALAGLHPLDFDPDEKWDFAASVGSYKSEQAVAIGAFYRPNEDTMFSIGGTIGNGNNMVNVGVSWKFGQKNRISANRISSAKEIIELRKNQEDVHSFLADAVAGNQLDLSKIQLFPDVEENHWAYDYVATMAGNGVLEGYPDGYFKGNRNMTRYEMAAVLYRLMQNGARLSDRALTEFAPELDRIRVDTITKHKDGTPHIQRVRTIKERVDEKSDLSPEKAEKKKAKIKVAEKPVE